MRRLLVFPIPKSQRKTFRIRPSISSSVSRRQRPLRAPAMASVLSVGSLSAFVEAAPPLPKPSRQPILTAGGVLLPRRAAAVVLRASAASKPAPSAGTRQPRGITKPRPVSQALQAIVGVPEIPRTQALKRIWAYIKEHNLQDPENKRIIVCDEKLKNLFGGKERVGFLEISGLLNPHFAK